MPTVHALETIARLPAPGDNTAIATRRLEAGDSVEFGGQQHSLTATILEGHRFAVQPIAAGDLLLSWGLPFGAATRPIAPGEYVCNERTLHSLRGRTLQAALPDAPNFVDRAIDYHLDAASFRPAPPPEPVADDRTFLGYRRSARRGVGTRNFVLLLGTSSYTGAFVRALEQELAPAALDYANLDGIVSAAHTEGAAPGANNREHVLRTLAGFMVHTNIAAVLAVDVGWEPINNAALRDFMLAHGYPLDDVPHHFMTMTGGFDDALRQAAAIVRGWLPAAAATPRTPQPIAHLSLALQCGGSDAFSGVSANPLIGWVAEQVIRRGGRANIAETPELIGAEPYMLDKVRDLATAQRYLAIRDRFVAYAAAHGTSAEGNPSDGNKLRGLYNIILKSIGAANKKHPATRLDYAIDYSERMSAPGFYFMDSPGLDLESVAGQVAAGCNVIFFTTGNGSVTNFPFVPTVKVVTTTPRFNLLAQDMDVNAGRYLDGEQMEALGAELLDLTLTVAGGQRTAGERAGHAQVQIWRNWRQSGEGKIGGLGDFEIGDWRLGGGAALAVKAPQREHAFTFTGVETPGGVALEQVGLIVPTSLCAAQVARLAADRLNRRRTGAPGFVSRYVALVHTEGCTDATGDAVRLSAPTLLGYATHPAVRRCLLLEHGCEVTHNDFMRHRLMEMGYDLEQFGWASVQLDGGIAAVLDKVEQWFAAQAVAAAEPPRQAAGLGALRLGLIATAPPPPEVARALAELTGAVATAGGVVIVSEAGHLLHSPAYVDATCAAPPAAPTLTYAHRPATAGCHLMAMPTDHPVEALTGLGAGGVDVILAYVGAHPIQGHPLTPVLQLAAAADCSPDVAADLDIVLAGDELTWPDEILERIAALAAHEYTPQGFRQGNIDFQITRGLLGISL
jgi:altronate dehydratase